MSPCRTSSARYKKHTYSGPKKSLKQVRAQLKRHHGSDLVSRDKVWREKNITPRNATPGIASDNNVKNYSRRKPILRVEATFDTPKFSQTSIPVTNTETEALEINWPVLDPTLESHKLTIEKTFDNKLAGLSGNRIVEIQHVVRWALAMGYHSGTCTGSTIEFVKELRDGFNSLFVFQCSMCGQEFRRSNENEEKLNTAFVWGTVTAGGYYTQAAHITNVMDIPTMSPLTFRNREKSLNDIWQDQLTEEIKKVGEQERELAITNGQISSDGIPYIEVLVDGGWAKRSYGHNYNSSSGMACIIGKNTKKCLYIGIKNKYCYHCQLYEKKGEQVPPHKCFKNYQGSSTSMEAEILVEGFQKSVEMHGVQYLSFIGDGDSSVFARLKEKVSYGSKIRKTECKNHVMKNYTSALYKIHANKKLPIIGRRLPKAKLTRLTTVAKTIIKQQVKNKLAMRTDLQNGPSHVFGVHEKCKPYYCKYTTTSESDENHVDCLKKEAPAVWALISAANEAVMAKTNRLTYATTNHVENFMSIISKFNCGKRLNLHKGGSYQRRVTVAGLSQLTGQSWHGPAWRNCTQSSPGKTFKKYIARCEKAKRRIKAYPRRRIFLKKVKALPDKSYGPEAQDTSDSVNMTDLKQMCDAKLQEFQKTPAEIQAIEESTVGQHDNDQYNIHRSDRLTASVFGLICKHRKTTKSHNKVKTVLYKSNATTKDILYGQQNESVARMFFTESYKKAVRPAGFFIDEQFGFLGASPDGVVQNEDAIIEVKCFPSLHRKNQDINNAAKNNKSFPIIEKNGILSLKPTHNYYYQVQGQLHITKKAKCYFICFIDVSSPITVIEVAKNENFINSMIPQLVKFYKTSILPEVILRRIPKGEKCVDLQ